MTKFILNNETIETNLPAGTTVLDFVRYRKNLKGTKIGCREGDCGACTVMVGELDGDRVRYRTMTSCLMPLANAAGKHIVTIEGINPADGGLTPAQAAMVECSGTQCGFCTVGFIMSMTNFCLDDSPKTVESAISAVDGNICRCTGYKSIERALAVVSGQLSVASDRVSAAVDRAFVPAYFADIKQRLWTLGNTENRQLTTDHRPLFTAGGTDLYVQRPEEMEAADANHLFDDESLRFIRETETEVEIGASVVVTDLFESEIFTRLFPDCYRHLKLVSSTPIRNMATLAGNFVNASPIGDMTAWFLALDADIVLTDGSSPNTRTISLKDFYLGYKKLAKSESEFISAIRFRKGFTHFNFEKVCKRQYLDIASVNTAISLNVLDSQIQKAHVSAGGVFATPLYLAKTSEFLRGKSITEETVNAAAAIIPTEIAPISDVRGSKEYKSLLLRKLFEAHFEKLI